MNNELYNSILSVINNSTLNIQCLDRLEQTFPQVKHGTLSSILSNETQKMTKSHFARVQDNAASIYDEYKQSVSTINSKPGVLMAMAESFRVPYTLIAKIVLTRHLLALAKSDDGEHEQQDSKVKDVPQEVKQQLRDTTLIDDKLLAREVFLCTMNDCEYSPTSEIIRMTLGQQYEIKLYREMDQAGILYRNENHLRQSGFDKTPDVKLEMPIAVNGFIVHWIESKARFADWDVHHEYLKSQYICYWNRFGPGLIIYWFGYVEGIDNDDEKRFIVRDRLPKNIFKLGN